jgi:demethylmenaquinone methyltransferase/2-methoxy-6-polyprenyl-1,4-benzoquinol methylase
MQRLESVLRTPGAKVLDLCCGTGDVMLELQSIAAAAVMGADFCHPMLLSAREKTLRKGFPAPLFEADALELPLAGDSLDAISIAFGFRNLANYTSGLLELHRVLKPGGVLAILEFSHPAGVLTKAAYGAYSRVVLPIIGTLISGSRSAYSYLPDSIRKFPRARELSLMLEQAGFAEAGFQLLSGGIAALHFAKKSAAGGARQAPVDLLPQRQVSHQAKQVIGMETQQFGG